MSSLNLVPNPTVMAVQAGLFIANFVAVKKLLLDPYLKVYDKRQNLTVGNKSEAAELVQKNESTMDDIKQQLLDASELATNMRNTMTSDANAKKAELVSKAESEAKSTVESVRAQIKESMQAEMSKVPGLVDELTNVIVKQVLDA